jgi:hypothetical protein
VQKKLLVPALILVVVGILVFVPGPKAEYGSSDSASDVTVTNFPDVQKVEGDVTVKGPLSHARLVRKESIIVPPSRRGDPTQMVQAGEVTTDGFSHVVLSLQGEVADAGYRGGTVGAVLVPDEEPVIRALNQAGRIEFPAEVVAQLVPGTGGYFGSKPTDNVVGFPRYRVYLYNSSGHGVQANLYVYMTN